MDTTTFVVRKDALASFQTRVSPPRPLADGRVRVAIAGFALSSNNITYAALGDTLDYWKFFPVSAADGTPDPSWGCIPVWGFGTVVASHHPGIAAGERLYGYFPMATQVDLVPTRVKDGSFADGAPHRAELHAVYNQYTRCHADPFHTPGTEALQALFRPLFTTSWLIDDFLADNAYFGAAQGSGRTPAMLLSSASSKTAYGTAFQMKERGGTEVIGLTSPRHVAFCESLRCYDRVIPYVDLSTLPADLPSVYVDFAGDKAVRRGVHEHFKALAYSCAIGATHLDGLGGAAGLPGPKPVMFFAPAQVKKRSAEWGQAVLNQRLVEAWQWFVAVVSGDTSPAPWVALRQQRGAAAVGAVYRELLAGRSDPREGHILAL
jgi:hypothetical protein